MLQMLIKNNEQIEITPLPDYVTVKEISYANGKVVRVVFRDADEIIKIVRAIKSHLTPRALDGAIAPDNQQVLPADVLVGEGTLPEPPRQ